ncbi:MAG: pilus assembly protein [Planctomycetota bacterium]|nr:MAG: pilus assembly protein [Planctomycetota bacterium]
MIRRFWERCRELPAEAESGQVMVEFALVFPVQLFLTLCVIQFAFLAHATLVVNQAAFLGARAGAVAIADPRVSVPEAGRREAARHVALLTSGDPAFSAGAVPAQGALEWNSRAGRYGYSAERQREAYALLQTTTERRPAGHVVCDVTYDYVMTVPVANHAFAVFGGGGRNVGGIRWTTFRVHRVGFIAAPWTREPLR